MFQRAAALFESAENTQKGSANIGTGEGLLIMTHFRPFEPLCKYGKEIAALCVGTGDRDSVRSERHPRKANSQVIFYFSITLKTYREMLDKRIKMVDKSGIATLISYGRAASLQGDTDEAI